MISNHPTKTHTKITINQNITTLPCLNKTENKYDDKIVNLTFVPQKEESKKIEVLNN